MNKDKSKSMFRGRPGPPRNIDLRKGRGPEARDIGSSSIFIGKNKTKSMFRGRPVPPRNIDLRKGRDPEARDIG